MERFFFGLYRSLRSTFQRVFLYDEFPENGREWKQVKPSATD